MKTDYSVTHQAHLQSPCTFGIDSIAHVLITYSSPEALPQIAELLASDYPTLPVMHLGAGSNLLPAHDYLGVMLKSEVRGIERHGNSVRVGAAETFDNLIT